MKRALLAIAAAALLWGCTAQPPIIPPSMELPQKVRDFSSTAGAGAATTSMQVTATPKPPESPRPPAAEPAMPATPGAVEEANITLNFEQIPLPTFISVVYGATLKRNVNIDPAVTARQDLVTIRTGKAQTPSQVADAARLLLKTYGIAVVDLGNLVRIVPDAALGGYSPEIRRGRALPETPQPLRPIFQLVELQAVRNTEITLWIRTMFGTKVTVQEDPGRNAVWLSGPSNDVAQALEALQMLDQPLMKGRNSVRIAPVYMSADELAKRLVEILQAEGYASGPAGAVALPINLVPIAALNALIVFAVDPAILQHVIAWAKDLDKPGTGGIGRSLFSYRVQYSDATALAGTLEKLLTGGQAGRVGTTAAAGAAPPALPNASRVVVDQASNTIIFQGSSEDYGQIRSLLELLDKPTAGVLIEVTVAEVSLTDDTQLGIEWLIQKTSLAGVVTRFGTAGGLPIGSSGFNYSRIDTANGRSVLLNALSTDNRATVLSSPRIVARNGETATIQVGQEVPIITSQQTSPTTGASGSVLQTVQYRSTGVILRVRPVIHSDNQIDLDVSQEVSVAQSTTTGVSTSPTFGTRKVETKLSLKDGSTVLLGGLISNDNTRGNAGIPLLKNIPILGQVFRTDTAKNNRTELIVLITPYVISNDNDAKAVTDAFRKQLGDWAREYRPDETGRAAPGRADGRR